MTTFFGGVMLLPRPHECCSHCTIVATSQQARERVSHDSEMLPPPPSTQQVWSSQVGVHQAVPSVAGQHKAPVAQAEAEGAALLPIPQRPAPPEGAPAATITSSA